MFEILIWASGVVLCSAVALAYVRTRDPLHPLVYLVPMFFYLHVFVPGVYYYQGILEECFVESASLVVAQTYTCLGLIALCIGCLLCHVRYSGEGNESYVPLISDGYERTRLRHVSYAVAAIGIAVYFYSLSKTGGLISSYSRAKGGGGSLPSGYVSVCPLLTIPAIMLFLLARERKAFDPKTILVMLIFISPHLIHGVLGGRRGALFPAGASLLFGWYLSTSHRPKLVPWTIAIVFLGITMLFFATHRRQLYLGSEQEMKEVPLTQLLMPTEDHRNHVGVFSLAMIVASDKAEHHFWGKRYAVQLFVRPIPRQLWSTKYEDTGMDAMVTSPGSGGMSETDWRRAVGWFPNRGSAVGLIADSFLEFAWWGLIVCFGAGALLGYLWKKAVVAKGVWIALYFEATVVSVFLPTQGLISAWGYRFLSMAVPTIVLWRWLVVKRLRPDAVASGACTGGNVVVQMSASSQNPEQPVR